MSPQQQAVLDFVDDYRHTFGYSPTLREIAIHRGLCSVVNAREIVDRLIRDGHLRRVDHQHRSLTVVAPKPRPKLRWPILGTISTKGVEAQ